MDDLPSIFRIWGEYRNNEDWIDQKKQGFINMPFASNGFQGDIIERFESQQKYIDFLLESGNVSRNDYRRAIGRFVFDMKKGDILIHLDWKNKTLGLIGKVGDYYMNPSFGHMRNVSWLIPDQTIQTLDQQIYNKLTYAKSNAFVKIDYDYHQFENLLLNHGIQINELPVPPKDNYMGKPSVQDYSFSLDDITKYASEFDFQIYDNDYQEAERIRRLIIHDYPLESWLNLPIEKYVLGLETNDDTFSKILEFRSNELGGIKGGSSAKHVIYKHKELDGWYYNTQKFKNLDDAWQSLRKGIHDLISLSQAGKWDEVFALNDIGSAMIRLKILYIYCPTDILPIYSPSKLRFIDKNLFSGKYTKQSDKDPLRLNRMLLKELKSLPCFKTLSNYHIMRFIWEEFIEKKTNVAIDVVLSETDANQISTHSYTLDDVDEYISVNFDERLKKIMAGIKRKKQVILYGPPGTGKTYFSELFSVFFIHYEQGNYNKCMEILKSPERRRRELQVLKQTGQLTSITFHPSYSYEDFIEGFRPVKSDNQGTQLDLVPGLFPTICDFARDNDTLPVLLFIDEINRAHLSKVFGELITLIEKDKRGVKTKLPYSKTEFLVPENVYIIGTMNTVDFSLKSLDFALRRRFSFVELPPDPSVLETDVENGFSTRLFLERINTRITKKFDRSKQIGHSYFMIMSDPVLQNEDFQDIFIHDIASLLEEYCHMNFNQLVEIVGPKLIDQENQKWRYEVLNNAEELINTLKEEFKL